MSWGEWVFVAFLYVNAGFLYRLFTTQRGADSGVAIDDFEASAAGVALVLVWPVASLRRTARWIGRNSPKVAKWLWLIVVCSVAFAVDPGDE